MSDLLAPPAAAPETLPPPFLTAEWRMLAILNYEVDPSALRPLVPAGTELDEWGGTTYASMVGFRFLRTRVMGLAIPGHMSFEEVNLRFYVRRRGPEGWRRGVVFVKEIVPRGAIAAVARVLYNEPYVRMSMRHWVKVAPEGGVAEYGWKYHTRWCSLRASFRGEPRPLVDGSEAEFITEHYWGYTRRRDGGTSEYRVEHPRWRVWDAAEATLACDAASLYGPQFAHALSAPPKSAYVAEGSPIVVRRGRRIA